MAWELVVEGLERFHRLLIATELDEHLRDLVQRVATELLVIASSRSFQDANGFVTLALRVQKSSVAQTGSIDLSEFWKSRLQLPERIEGSARVPGFEISSQVVKGVTAKLGGSDLGRSKALDRFGAIPLCRIGDPESKGRQSSRYGRPRRIFTKHTGKNYFPFLDGRNV